MKLLVVSDVNPVTVLGGAERVVREEALRLAGRGHRVVLLARDPGGRTLREGSLNGVSLITFPVPPPSTLRYALASILRARAVFFALHRREAFQVLILHQPFSAFGVLLARARQALPCVYTFHSPAFLEFTTRRGRWPLLPAGLWAVERSCLRRADRIRVLSRYSQGLVRRHYGITEEKTMVIPGGVDLQRFVPAERRRALKAALGCPETAFLLVTIRNLVPRMGLESLLHAMKTVAEVRKDVVLIIGGEGPMEQDLKGSARRLDLGSSVRFEGYIPEEKLPIYYQAADFFILPTKELEGFGLVAVEALASGTPVLGTPVGAIPEILGPLQEDLVFAGTDPHAIARGILTHLERAQADPSGYEALRRRCRVYTEAHFGWEAHISRLEQELSGLAGR